MSLSTRLGRFVAVALAAALTAFAAPARAEMALLMFEQAGCLYCQHWNSEIAPKYALNEEGKAAPLRRLNIHGDLPENLSLDRPPVFTPTFVLISGGTEIGRIEGYPGEDFFWGLLGSLLSETPGL